MACDITTWLEARNNSGAWEFVHEYREDGDGFIEYEEVYYGRNYFLFAFLADVRNNHRIIPLSEPRGLPKDVSAVGKKIYNSMHGEYVHSWSWFTAAELLAVDWKYTMVKLSGYLTEADKDNLEKGRNPEKWTVEATSENVHFCQWEESLYLLCKDFVDGFLPELQKYGDAEAVRLVFFFDN
jgi:hypothetical protein